MTKVIRYLLCDLLKELKIKGQIVVADALNRQKETAEIIIKQKENYLLCVKDNHPNLKKGDFG